MPQLRPWEMDRSKLVNGGFTFISFRTAERLYDAINFEPALVINGENVILLMSKKKFMCSAAVKDNKSSGEPALKIISRVMFYHPNPASKLPDDIINPLQVSNVWTEHEYEGSGVASYMYASLVRDGFTIISDRIQYLGGKELWKKMSREAGLSDYRINIWNEDSGYIQDHGTPIEYNTQNIDDADIWQTTDIGRKTVLILRTRV